MSIPKDIRPNNARSGPLTRSTATRSRLRRRSYGSRIAIPASMPRKYSALQARSIQYTSRIPYP